MPLIRSALIVVLLMGISLPSAAAGRLALIAAPDSVIRSADRVMLRRIYRSKLVIDDDGHRLVPVNLPSGNAVREAFSQSVLGSPSQALQSYWNEQYFLGVRPPVVVESEEAMMRFVATTLGALGYVADCHVDDRVRVIGYIDLDEGSPAVADCAGQ